MAKLSKVLHRQINYSNRNRKKKTSITQYKTVTKLQNNTFIHNNKLYKQFSAFPEMVTLTQKPL